MYGGTCKTKGKNSFCENWCRYDWAKVKYNGFVTGSSWVTGTLMLYCSFSNYKGPSKTCKCLFIATVNALRGELLKGRLCEWQCQVWSLSGRRRKGRFAHYVFWWKDIYSLGEPQVIWQQLSSFLAVETKWTLCTDLQYTFSFNLFEKMDSNLQQWCGVVNSCVGCKQLFMIMLNVGEGNLPWWDGVSCPPQSALSSAGSLPNNCLKFCYKTLPIPRHWNIQ